MMNALIVIPAYNEEQIIRQTVTRTLDFLQQQHRDHWRLLVAENGSQDRTVEILQSLAAEYPAARFGFQSFAVRSKSDAIKQAWLSEDADVYIHMDADLSTDLADLPTLVDGIREGCDIVIGSRCLAGSDASRSVRRSSISHVYNCLIRWFFSLNVTDFQCGFKAVGRRARDEIVRRTRHLSEGFMDTEMLILASARGFRIKEIPVHWCDQRKSKFNAKLVAARFLKNMFLVKLDLLRGRYD